MFHVRARVFLNCDRPKSKLGMFQAASKVSSMVGLLDVESVLDVDQDALLIITLNSTGHTERSTSIHCILVITS